MRGEVVSQLVLIVTTQSKPKPRVHGEAAIIEPIVRFWANSRMMLGISCLGILVCGVGYGTYTRQPVLSQISGTAAIVALLIWWLMRWVHYRDQIEAIEALTKVFASQRVTQQEWTEAMRLIRMTNEEFLRYGIEDRFSAMCMA